MSFTLDVRTKNFFFDTAVVKRMVNEQERRGLSRIGAFLRTRMRSSLKRRQGPSRRGQPPHVHTSDPFASLKNIRFAYEPARHGVVAGPLRLSRRSKVAIQSTTVPESLEHGGTIGLREAFVPLRRKGKKLTRGGRKRLSRPAVVNGVAGEWRPSSRPKPGQPRRVERIVLASRPFAAPALRTEIQKGTIPSIFTARGG